MSFAYVAYEEGDPSRRVINGKEIDQIPDTFFLDVCVTFWKLDLRSILLLT